MSTDSLWDKIREDIGIKGKGYEIGYFPDATYDNGQSVAAVMKWNNDGYSVNHTVIFRKKAYGKRNAETFIVPPHTVPPRPFRDITEEKYAGLARDMAARLIKQGVKEDRALQLAAKTLADNMKHVITELKEPANAPLTVYLKGSTNPLMDTSKARNAVTWRRT